MTANFNPIFVLAYKTAMVQILPADTTTKKTVLTAGANGCRVTAINVSTDDTVVEDVGLFIQIGGSGSVVPIGTKRVALRSGDPTLANNTTPSVNLLDAAYIASLDLDGTLALGPGDVLQVAVLATITAAKTTTFVGLYGDY